MQCVVLKINNYKSFKFLYVMKKLFIQIFFFLSVLSSAADDAFYAYYRNGDIVRNSTVEIDSVSLVKPGASVVFDICGNAYHEISIGDQVWLKEDMHCNKYDTKSGFYGTIIPFYYDCAHDTDEGFEELHQRYCILNEYGGKTYYLYNWMAGIGDDSGTSSMDYQGICPDGFRLPKRSDWEELFNYDGFSMYNCNIALKSSTGWNGIDKYGFSAMPYRYYNVSDLVFDVNSLYINSTWIAGGQVGWVQFNNTGPSVNYYSTYDHFTPFGAVRCIKK